MKIKTLASAAAMVLGVAGASVMSIGSTALVGAAAYTAVAVTTTTTGIADAEARRSSSSRSSFSSRSSSSRSSYSAPTPAPKPAYVAPKPAASAVGNSSRGAPVASSNVAKPATPAPAASSSMIGKNVSKPAVATTSRTLPSRTTPARAAPTRYSSTPPVNRTWNTNPAQRASNGSIMQPLLIGAAAGIGGAMLYDWLSSPSTSSTTTTTSAAAPVGADTAAASSANEGGLKVVAPTANFKKFEGSQIPEKYQEVMKKQGLSIEPKQGDVTEYSKKVKIKDGIEITVDVAELPVLVIYVNEAGKPSEALFMPM